MIVLAFLSNELPLDDKEPLRPTLPQTEAGGPGENRAPPEPPEFFFLGVNPVLRLMPAISPILSSTP